MARPAPLFLDAARLGTMSPSAQRAARDFARLAGEGRSMLYWENFVRCGFSPSRSPPKLPGLIGWTGLSGLRDAVRQLLAAPAETPVFFASRTTALMQSAIRFVATHCRSILTTDSLWPPYYALLNSQCSSFGTPPEVTHIRDEVLSGTISRAEVIRRIAQTFAAGRHDALVVSSVSHEGVRLPLARLVSAIRAVNPSALVVVDGAQEFAHVPTSLSKAPCDIYLAGCHKWLSAYQPLAIAVLPNPRTAGLIQADLCGSPVNDSLFQYLSWLEGHTSDELIETINVTPLVCAWGAISDLVDRSHFTHFYGFRRRLQNARRLAAEASTFGWTASRPLPGLRSGILLLNPFEALRHDLPAAVLQRRFARFGVLLTVLTEGTIRVSFPSRELQPNEWALLRQSLRIWPSPHIRHGQ